MPISLKQRCSRAALTLLIACFVWNCGGDQKEAPTPSVVSKKIAAQAQTKAAPTSGEKEAAPAAAKMDAPVAEAKSQPEADQRIYDPEKRLNPFLPLFKAEKEKAPIDEQAGKKKSRRRVPQTPLERISLNQLKLVAIIRASSGNRALVEDSSGKGYIIKPGTYIGLNAGIVTQIKANSVVVEEEKENLMGELVLENTEMKLQKPTGE